MKYTVITKMGRVKQFYIREVAETFARLHGVNVFTADILGEAEYAQVRLVCAQRRGQATPRSVS
jgi:hypothetical protein